jgi:hypothetical protein
MTRPRGFMAGWNPRPASVALIEKTRAVLADYAAQLPLTIRQIFYRLVGADGYEKTEQAYKRLGELLNKARRARLIDMDAIRDDGFTSQLTTFFANAEAFINNAIAWAEELRLDPRRARRAGWWCGARPRAWCRNWRASPIPTASRCAARAASTA